MTTITAPKRDWFTFSSLLGGVEGLLIIIACYITLFLKPIRAKWGLRSDLVKRKYPGDDIISDPKTEFTHGIEINAPSEFVWPWIAQMGQGRGGFYSYELLENLIGLEIYNSNKIIPAYQKPFVGDRIPFGPATAYPLVICDPGKAMVIEHCENMDTKSECIPGERLPVNYLHLSWLWYLEDVDEEKSRFVSRNRLAYNTSFKNKLVIDVLAEPIVFAMDRKMCLGIRRRAEDYYREWKKWSAPPEI